MLIAVYFKTYFQQTTKIQPTELILQWKSYRHEPAELHPHSSLRHCGGNPLPPVGCCRMIPAEYAWGGQIHERKELYAMETVSIGILLFFGWLLMMKGGYIQRKINDKIIHVLLWLFFILFLLNTIGNLFAKTAFEKSLSLLTLFFAALLLRILIPPQNKKD